MRKLLFLVLLAPANLFGQFRLSDQTEISVITCGPSQEELYTAFGHSAIRVHDPVHQYDAAYNYGVFDFDQPNFYLNFARGYLFYKLGVYDYQAFQNHYIYDNRFVHEQVLNLTPEQKQKVFDFLERNALPQNMTYRYDYFYNNCATKVRDVFIEALGADVVKFDGSYVKTEYSIRELTDLYLAQQPWGDLGIDICLGLPMDKTATPFEYMFLPDYIESGFDHATILNDSMQHNSIVKEKHVIYEAREQDAERGWPHPLYVFIAIAVIGIALSIFDLRRNHATNWFDVVLFGVTGAIGVLLFFLWFFTDHKAAATNFNLLWAFPLHVIATFAFIRNPRWLKPYFAFTAILSVALLVTWGLLPQMLHYSLIPLVILQAVRAFTQFKVRNRQALAD